MRTYARRFAMSCGTTSIRLSTLCKTVHCLIMDRCAQKCSMRNVRMRAEFVSMEKSRVTDKFQFSHPPSKPQKGFITGESICIGSGVTRQIIAAL